MHIFAALLAIWSLSLLSLVFSLPAEFFHDDADPETEKEAPINFVSPPRSKPA